MALGGGPRSPRPPRRLFLRRQPASRARLPPASQGFALTFAARRLGAPLRSPPVLFSPSEQSSSTTATLHTSDLSVLGARFGKPFSPRQKQISYISSVHIDRTEVRCLLFFFLRRGGGDTIDTGLPLKCGAIELQTIGKGFGARRETQIV